jgi:hypothetical protein
MLNEYKRVLRRSEAAEYIRCKYHIPCAETSLRTLASSGGGPAFRKVGRVVLYETVDLDEWIQSKTSNKVHCGKHLSRPASR